MPDEEVNRRRSKLNRQAVSVGIVSENLSRSSNANSSHGQGPGYENKGKQRVGKEKKLVTDRH